MAAADDRLARAWDEAADGYEAYFVPRFAPWVELAVTGLAAAELPDGPILVPCCGTFPEADAVTRRLGDRETVGLDLSPGMIQRARARIAEAGWSAVSALVADAATLDPRWSARCAAVVSVFGLQQLPDPRGALRSWLAALAPGGRLSVVYWPQVVETDGPFALGRAVVREHLPPSEAGDWEAGLAAELSANGAELVRDELVAYPMTHPDASAYFEAFTRSGPGRALADARGEDFVARLRAEFLRRAPAGEWTHHPRARLLVARR